MNLWVKYYEYTRNLLHIAQRNHLKDVADQNCNDCLSFYYTNNEYWHLLLDIAICLAFQCDKHKEMIDVQIV